MHYFPLDGLLAERLFAAFDKDRNGRIDCNEFLGMVSIKYQILINLTPKTVVFRVTQISE